MAHAHAKGLVTGLSTNGRILADPQITGRLEAVGLDEVTISLHAITPEIHIALVGGDPLAYQQTLEAVRACASMFQLTIRTVLTRANQGELAALIALAAEVGAAFELRALSPVGAAKRAWRDLALSDDAALDLLLAARREATRLGVAFTGSDFPTHGRLVGAPPLDGAVPDEHVWWAAQQGLATRQMLGGLRAPSPEVFADWSTQAGLAPEALAHDLATRHLPLLDIPVSWGGTGSRPVADAWSDTPDPASPYAAAAGGPVHVIDAALDQPWLGLSLWPGLVQRLRDQGAEVVHHRIWTAPFDPASFDPPMPRSMLGRVARGLRRAVRRADESPTLPHPARPGEEAAAVRARFMEHLDLSGAHVVVVADHATAREVRAHPTCPPDARLEILELQLLSGFEGDLGDRDVVRSPWPSRRRLYDVAGVDGPRIRWRPEPVYLPHLPEGCAAHASKTVILVTGDDLDPRLVDKTLAKHKVDVVRVPPGEPEDGDWTPLLQALSRARFVWMPFRARRGVPPAVRWASLATAARRPILATEIPELTHHVRPAKHGILTEPGQLKPMRAAFGRLMKDDALVQQLAAVCDARREAISAASWARELVEGARRPRSVSAQSDRGPWWLW
jgi:hypothetical protein